MDTALLIIAYIPLLGWLIWRGIKPFMLCRDVEAGTITKDALIHLLIEAVIYIAVPLFIIPKNMWRSVNTAIFGAMFLIGMTGIIRTAIAYIRIKKTSNQRLEATDEPGGGSSEPQP